MIIYEIIFSFSVDWRRCVNCVCVPMLMFACVEGSYALFLFFCGHFALCGNVGLLCSNIGLFCGHDVVLSSAETPSLFFCGYSVVL